MRVSVKFVDPPIELDSAQIKLLGGRLEVGVESLDGSLELPVFARELGDSLRVAGHGGRLEGPKIRFRL